MTTSIKTSNILPRNTQAEYIDFRNNLLAYEQEKERCRKITQSTLDELEDYDQMVDDMAGDMIIAGSSIWDDYEVRQALESGDTDRAFALIDNLCTTDWM